MALLHYQPPLRPYLSIVYRDEDIVVLNKPSGLLSVPGKAAEHKDSLELRVKRVFPTARLVHRLDMATSGLILMAMHKDAQRHLSAQFERRQTSKTYHARVYGQVDTEQGEIDLPLICDWPNRPKQMVDWQRGKKAQTFYRVLERKEAETLVELTPVTGRSHQLRVHMLSLGHPILGDRLYAHPQALEAAQRLQLHASKIGFRHPQSGEPMAFSCPADFA